ncbi:hypothetical protein BS47DRAFT_1367481 [Hydnum rufescens UP504]|uniref:Uncharacterized protein n=1 Tax=Hydnum rufescens UP504 TaxID=1448309 RepID=A0A9P6AI30_9AGAM|nr:hypothetical protein BS47DRAFT_1367481 [Hydnum rufescens UP504]
MNPPVSCLCFFYLDIWLAPSSHQYYPFPWLWLVPWDPSWESRTSDDAGMFDDGETFKDAESLKGPGMLDSMAVSAEEDASDGLVDSEVEGNMAWFLPGLCTSISMRASQTYTINRRTWFSKKTVRESAGLTRANASKKKVRKWQPGLYMWGPPGFALMGDFSNLVGAPGAFRGDFGPSDKGPQGPLALNLENDWGPQRPV